MLGTIGLSLDKGPDSSCRDGMKFRFEHVSVFDRGDSLSDEIGVESLMSW